MYLAQITTLIQPVLKTCFTSFTSSVSRMSEFGLLIMYITYVVPRPYKILIDEKKKVYLTKHKIMIKVLRYF